MSSHVRASFTAERERETMQSSCPECKSEFIQRVTQTHFVGSLLSRFSIQPFRCQLCRHRFVKLTTGTDRKDDANGTREYRRVPTHVPATLVGDFPTSQEVISELSMGGCTLHTPTHPLKTGSFIQMNVKTSETEKPIRIDTVMIRSVRPESIGVEFLEFREEEKKRLSSFVKELLRSQPTAP